MPHPIDPFQYAALSTLRLVTATAQVHALSVAETHKAGTLDTVMSRRFREIGLQLRLLADLLDPPDTTALEEAQADLAAAQASLHA